MLICHDLEYHPKDEQHFAWLHRSAGSVLVTDTEEEQGYLREVLEGLLKYQIGVLVSESEAQPGPGSTHLLFTEATLRGYDNPTDGVYTAIGDYVYRLTGTLIPSVTHLNRSNIDDSNPCRLH